MNQVELNITEIKTIIEPIEAFRVNEIKSETLLTLSFLKIHQIIFI